MAHDGVTADRPRQPGCRGSRTEHLRGRRRDIQWTVATTERYDVPADRWHELDALLAVGRASLSAAHVMDSGPAHSERSLLVAFGGFEVAGGQPIASARVEALPVHGG